MSNSDTEEPEYPVHLVPEPKTPNRSVQGRLIPSWNGKRQKGIPIDVPKTQPRHSFSAEAPNHSLLTGYRDGGNSRRRSSTSTQSISPFTGRNDEFDIIGQITGAMRSPNDKAKSKSTNVVLLSDEDDQRDQRNFKRKKVGGQSSGVVSSTTESSGAPLSIVARMKKHTPSKETTSRTTMHFPPTEPSSLNVRPTRSTRPTSPTRIYPPTRVQQSTSVYAPLSVKAPALGMGTFPQATLTCVRLMNKVDFNTSGMTIQFGPDRLLINIDKNITRIPHHGLRFVEYNADGDLVILRIQTEDQLPLTSKLESYYDPAPNSGKAKRIILFIKCDALFIEEQLKKLSEKGVNTSHLSSEIAAKIRSLESRSIRADASSTSAGDIKTAKRASQHNETLFLFPFKSNSKSKSIAIQSEDISRLNDGEFLNDTLIEFGLKHVYANVEARNPDLADKTYIFNSFFYERLLTKSGKSIQYDSVKSWTNKIDLFSKKYIIIPIHENLHWYLAIITNPGLLLKTEEDTEPSSGSQMSLSYLDFDSNVSIDDIVTPSLTNGDTSKYPDELERESLVRSESRVSQETLPNQRHDDGPGPQKRKLRSMTPSVATPVDPEERPYIIVLDSLGGSHPGVFRSLRLYLQQELLARKNIERTVDSKDVPGKLAKCPQQENFCDCGLFLLHYAEVFLKHPGPMLNGIVNRTDDMNRYWSVGDLAQKREKYREIMISLTEEYKSYLFSQKQIEQIKEANQHSNQSQKNER